MVLLVRFKVFCLLKDKRLLKMLNQLLSQLSVKSDKNSYLIKKDFYNHTGSMVSNLKHGSQ